VKTSLVGFFFVISAITAQQLNAANIFYFTSSPTSWVGHGETRTITPSQGFTFGVSKYASQGAYTNALNIAVTNFDTAPPSQYDWWYLHFVGPNTTAANAGYYPDAQRWPFQDAGHPGLDFSGNGRGNNTLTGQFRVLEAVYSGTAVQRLAVDFMQFDSGSTSKWNWGSFRYNSDIPLTTIPEPSSLALILVGAGLYVLRRRRA
jgi:hypothetical protein